MDPVEEFRSRFLKLKTAVREMHIYWTVAGEDLWTTILLRGEDGKELNFFVVQGAEKETIVALANVVKEERGASAISQTDVGADHLVVWLRPDEG